MNGTEKKDRPAVQTRRKKKEEGGRRAGGKFDQRQIDKSIIEKLDSETSSFLYYLPSKVPKQVLLSL